MIVKLSNDQWVQLYSEIAEQIMANGPSGMSEYLIEVENDDGTVTAGPFEFHMPGYWLIQVTLADEEGNEEQVRFDVDCCE